jgi:L-aspartate oxidase
MSRLQIVEADLLVVGSGAAGLYAALCAAREHSQVALITRSDLKTSSSAWAQGGIAAAISPDDSPELHFKDTIEAGRGLCDKQAVQILTEAAPRCVRDLESLGVAFDRDRTGLALGREGGHSRRRILHAGGSATGAYLIRALSERVQETKAIQLVEHAIAWKLISDGQRCFGAVIYDLSERAFRAWLAPATVLATGGAAGLYWRTTNPPTAAGEGLALAHRAGAELMDLEFMQFHPTALCLKNGRSILISEAVRGEGAQLLNQAGQRFMPAYHELAELAPRDVVARAIYAEMKRSRSRCVFLSLQHLQSEFIKKRFANIYQECLAQGVDITRELVPVAPAAHYTVGGVRTNLDGRTTVAGLWGCGEVAATGVHGANRLASNSLLECIVFAGRSVHDALRTELPQRSIPQDALGDFQDTPVEPEPDFTPLAQLMTERVGLVRTDDGLQRACDSIDQLWRKYPESPSGWCNRLLVARLMTEAALLRTETRGVHTREDFPGTDPRWQRHIILRRDAEPEYLEV